MRKRASKSKLRRPSRQKRIGEAVGAIKQSETTLQRIHRYSFDPNSLDAQFASLHSMFRGQNTVLEEIREHTKATNGRVTALENARTLSKGWIAGAGVVCSAVASAVSIFAYKLFPLIHH